MDDNRINLEDFHLLHQEYLGSEKEANKIHPLVSICCQTYNHKDYIVEALEGFLMQKTDFVFEILLRDDASTDGTADICFKYANKYPDKIRLLAYTENQWEKKVSPFRDNLKRAKGKYIALCEGDDFWTDPLKLQKQVDFLEANEEYSYCGHKSFSLENEILIPIEINCKEISLPVLLNKNMLNSATLVFRKSCIVTPTTLLENAPAGDWLLQLLALRAGNGYVLDDNMSVYRKHVGGIWSSLPAKEMCENGVTTLKLAKQIFNDKKINLLIDKAIIERRKNFNIIQISIIKRIRLRINKILKFRY